MKDHKRNWIVIIQDRKYLAYTKYWYLWYHLNIRFLKRRLFEYGDGQYWHSMMNTMNVYTKRVELSQHLLGINKKGHYPYLIPEEIMLHWHHLHIISSVLLTKRILVTFISKTLKLIFSHVYTHEIYSNSPSS